MSSLKKATIIVLVICATTAVLILIRPDGTVEPDGLDREHQTDSILESFSDTLSDSNLRKMKEKKESQEVAMAEKREAEKNRAAQEKEKLVASSSETGGRQPEPAQSGDFSVEKSYARHGKNAVVKATGVLGDIEKPDYTVREADFDNPRPITYHSLKKVYTYFRLKNGTFPPEVVKALNGTAVEITGAVMPAVPVPENGRMPTFWIANPVVVMAGCVFCNPPTMADLIYVETPTGAEPFVVDREKLFTNIVMIRLTGRFFFGPEKDEDREYIYSIVYRSTELLN